MNLTFANLILNIVGLLKFLIAPIVGLAVLVFLYGLLNYLLNSGDETKRREGVKYMFYGIIGLFVMISMWGLVYILAEFFGLGFTIPQITY